MTTHAKSLTIRATMAESRPSAPASPGPPLAPKFTFSSQVVRPMVDALERAGLDAEALLRHAGLTRALLDDPDGSVGCAPYGALLALAQAELPGESLGLRLAQVTPIGAYPLVDYLVLSSATVGEGLRRLCRYHRLVGSPSPFVLHEHENPIRVDVGAVGIPFGAEFGVAINLLHLRSESEGRAVAQWVSLIHSPNNPAAFERALGCPVRVNATWNGFALTPEVWQAPMRRHDAVLLRLLEPRAEAADSAPLPSMSARVRQAQARGLPTGEASVGAVARALAVSPRTLQRRLADEGASFQQLLDDVRREMAEQHLSDSALAIAEISFLLGYSEPAAFHRAFKRWRRATPQAYRAQRRA